MARQNITVGIDLGTALTRCVVVAGNGEVLASVSTQTRGVRHGYIVSLPDAAASIRRVADLAEKEIGQPIKRATFSIGGISLAAETARRLACDASVVRLVEDDGVRVDKEPGTTRTCCRCTSLARRSTRLSDWLRWTRCASTAIAY